MTSETQEKQEKEDEHAKIQKIYDHTRIITHREQRLKVNFLLLVYWFPAYIYDYWLQFPSFDGVHVFSDFLSNWGQTIILLHLIFSLIMDLVPDEDRAALKKYHNKFTQIAVVQAFIVSALFWGLLGDRFDWQSIHEHAINVLVIMTSYFVSEVRFRKRDCFIFYAYGWAYMANTYWAYLRNRDSIYSILAWGETDEPSTFPLTTFQLAFVSIFGAASVLHGLMYVIDRIRWLVYERAEKRNRLQLAMAKMGS